MAVCGVKCGREKSVINRVFNLDHDFLHMHTQRKGGVEFLHQFYKMSIKIKSIY